MKSGAHRPGRRLSMLTLACLAILLQGSLPRSGADLSAIVRAANVLTFPDHGKTENDFVPSGWKIWKSATGDLNGDGRPDKALIIVQKDDNPENPSQTLKPVRVILVAIQSPDGSLKTEVKNFNAILSGQPATDFGLNSVKIVIDHGNLILTNAGGGTNAQTVVATFHKHDWEEMVLVDLTRSSCNLKEHKQSDWHHDLKTGLVVSSLTTWQDDGHGKRKKGSDKTQTQKYYLLRVGQITYAPKIDAKIETREWPGVEIGLNSRDNLVAGKELCKGPNDFGITLGALHIRNSLFICGAIYGTHLDPEDKFVLFDAKGNEIPPKETKTDFSSTLTIFESRYEFKELSDNLNAQKCWLLPLGIEVQNIDPKTKKPRIILSTNPGGRKSPAGILICKSARPLLMAHWNLGVPDD
jgi:hypothetical protein